MSVRSHRPPPARSVAGPTSSPRPRHSHSCGHRTHPPTHPPPPPQTAMIGVEYLCPSHAGSIAAPAPRSEYGRTAMQEDNGRSLVELRIHGVSGTPPEGMLDARVVSRIAGDATTGFYALEPDEPLVGIAPDDRPRRLEGYSWRGMTSGAPIQALWVLLAPFALANMAGAMRPPVDEAPRWRFVTAIHGA